MAERDSLASCGAGYHHRMSKTTSIYWNALSSASRPPHEMHGPFRTETGCVVLEVSFPNGVIG